jgi:hypothetical protein
MMKVISKVVMEMKKMKMNTKVKVKKEKMKKNMTLPKVLSQIY